MPTVFTAWSGSLSGAFRQQLQRGIKIVVGHFSERASGILARKRGRVSEGDGRSVLAAGIFAEMLDDPAALAPAAAVRPAAGDEEWSRIV